LVANWEAGKHGLADRVTFKAVARGVFDAVECIEFIVKIEMPAMYHITEGTHLATQ